MPLSRHSGKHREPAGQAAISTGLLRPESAFLLCRLDEHLRCARAHAGTPLADDGALEAKDGMLLFGVGAAYIFTVRKAYRALMIRPHVVKIWCSRALM